MSIFLYLCLSTHFSHTFTTTTLQHIPTATTSAASTASVSVDISVDTEVQDVSACKDDGGGSDIKNRMPNLNVNTLGKAARTGVGGIGTSAYTIWGIATGTGQSSSNLVFYAGGGAGYGSAVGGGIVFPVAGGLGGGGQTQASGTANTGGTTSFGSHCTATGGYGGYYDYWGIAQDGGDGLGATGDFNITGQSFKPAGSLFSYGQGDHRPDTASIPNGMVLIEY